MDLRDEERPERMNRRDRKKQEQEMIHKMDLQKLEKAFGEKLNLEEKPLIESKEIEVENRGKYRKHREERREGHDYNESFNARGYGRRERGRRNYQDQPLNHFQILLESNADQHSNSSKEKGQKREQIKAQLQEIKQIAQRWQRPQHQRGHRGRGRGQGWQKHHHKNFQEGFQGQNRQFYYRQKNYHRVPQQNIAEKGEDQNRWEHGKHRGHRQGRGNRDKQFRKQERINGSQAQKNDYKDFRQQRNQNQQGQQYRKQHHKRHHEDRRREGGDRQDKRHHKRWERDSEKNSTQNNKNQPKQMAKLPAQQPKKQNKPIEHPEYLLCPITQILMESPYLLAVCGHTFEQNVIRQWLFKQQKCPLCNKPAQVQHLVKNFALAEVCRTFK